MQSLWLPKVRDGLLGAWKSFRDVELQGLGSEGLGVCILGFVV